MKKAILRSAVIFIVMILFLYSGIAFIHLESNPMNWNEGSRVTFTLVGFAIITISSIPIMSKLDKNN